LWTQGIDLNQREGGNRVDSEYTAIVKQQGDWWIGWIEEGPGVNCQERTRQELIDTLRITPPVALSDPAGTLLKACNAGLVDIE